MSSSSATARGVLPEALRDALGQVIANERREWRREREAMQSEMHATIAEMRANIAEERALGATIDGKPSTKRTLKDFTDAAADAVAKEIVRLREAAQRSEEGRDEAFGRLKADLAVQTAARQMGAKERGAVNVRGTWAKVGTYRQNDIVALNGGSFIARRDNPGPCPGEGWQLLAAQGKRGNRTPAVVGLSITAEGMMTLRNGDGSIVKLDLYPLLSKLTPAQAR